MMASNRAKQISKQNSKLIDELISRLTSFKNDQAHDVRNTNMAKNYVNFVLYKKPFLSVLPCDVWNKVNRITERFQNHAEHRKTKAWISLTASLKTRTTADNEESLTAVLFVLMQVANLRTRLSSEQSFERILEVSEPSSAGSVFNEDADPNCPAFDNRSESSVSSGDSDDSNEHRCLISVDSGAGNSPDVELEPPLLPPDNVPEQVGLGCEHAYSDFWEDGIIKPYWMLWDDRPKYITEQALMTEIIWMLQGNRDVFLFQWNGKNFYLREGTRLIDVDQNMLQSVCSEVCKCAQYIVELQDFYEQLSILSKPRILQAFALVLKQSTNQIKSKLIKLESEMSDEENALTLLSLLDKLDPTLKLIQCLWHMLQAGVVQRPPVALSASSQAMHLLHSLYKAATEEDSIYGHNSLLLPVLTNAFLETCKPFLNFIDQLLTEGEIDDPHNEFVIERLSEENKQECDNVLVFREIPVQYREGFVLYELLQEVVLASSLTVILKDSHCFDYSQGTLNVSLADQFITLCSSELNLINPVVEEMQTHQNGVTSDKRTDTILSITDFLSKFDPLLRANFDRIFPPVPLPDEFKQEKRVVSETTLLVKRNKPLNLFLEETLNSLVSSKCKHIHKQVMQVLKDDLCVQDHLHVVRRFFLFEDGYSMCTLTKEILKRMVKSRPWTSPRFLNSVFSDLLSKTNLRHSELMSVSLKVEKITPANADSLDELTALCLSYSAPSPVNLILNNESMAIYQNIFCFLMKLNCAKSSLEMLKFYDLSYPGGDVSSVMAQTMSMYMFKLHLLHLVNRLHFYFLTGLLQNKQVSFSAGLDSASNFHNVLCLHQEHLKDLQLFCLLAPSCLFLNSIICNILNLVLSFSKSWKLQTLFTGMKKVVVFENDFHRYIWTFNRAFSLLRSEQATKHGVKHVQHSDFVNLANIFSCQMNIPRPQFLLPENAI